MTRSDRGVHHTFALNLDVLEQHLARVPLTAAQAEAVRLGIDGVRQAIGSCGQEPGPETSREDRRAHALVREPEEVDRDAG